jgi:hypothetical protein
MASFGKKISYTFIFAGLRHKARTLQRCEKLYIVTIKNSRLDKESLLSCG